MKQQVRLRGSGQATSLAATIPFRVVRLFNFTDKEQVWCSPVRGLDEYGKLVDVILLSKVDPEEVGLKLELFSYREQHNRNQDQILADARANAENRRAVSQQRLQSRRKAQKKYQAKKRVAAKQALIDSGAVLAVVKGRKTWVKPDTPAAKHITSVNVVQVDSSWQDGTVPSDWVYDKEKGDFVPPQEKV